MTPDLRALLETAIERLRIELQTPDDIWSSHIEEVIRILEAALASRGDGAEEELPPGLEAILALFREDPKAWHAEWQRKHDFKVNLIQENERLRASRSDGGPHKTSPLPDHDNHHNALMCPYCNPKGLKFAESSGDGGPTTKAEWRAVAIDFHNALVGHKMAGAFNHTLCDRAVEAHDALLAMEASETVGGDGGPQDNLLVAFLKKDVVAAHLELDRRGVMRTRNVLNRAGDGRQDITLGLTERLALLAGDGGPDLRAWQDISIAPKDGTAVLLWEPDACEVMTGAYVNFEASGGAPEGYHSGWFDRIHGHHEMQPTHWMPLPLPPAQEPSV